MNARPLPNTVLFCEDTKHIKRVFVEDFEDTTQLQTAVMAFHSEFPGVELIEVARLH